MEENVNWFILYLLTRCEALNNLGVLASIIFSVATLGVLTACLMLISEHDKDTARTVWSMYGRWTLIGLIVSLVLSVIVPTNQDVALIIAGHWATNSEEMAELPDNVVRFMNKYLEDQVEPKE